MSWKRRNPEKPSEEDDEDILEEGIDLAPDILEVNDTEFLDEEALLQGGAEDDDVDEGTNDDLLEGDISGETRSARQKETVEGDDIGLCISDTLQSTVEELLVSPGQVCKEEAKIEKSQSDGSEKAEGTQYCEDKSSATQSFGPQKPKGGDTSEAATTRAQPAGRKQDTSKKTSALESSSVLAASEQPGKSLRGDAHRITTDKGETSGSAGRDFSSSCSGAASRGGRFSARTDRPDRAARGSNGLQQSRRDSRFVHRRPYSRGHSDSHGKQPRMPYAARPSIGMSQPSRSSFGTSQPYRPASIGPPHAQQPRMPYAVRPPFETPPTNRPAVSCDLSQAHLRDLLRVVIGATVSGPKRTPEMPAIETNSTFVGPALGSIGLDGSCSPGLAASGASHQPPLPHQRWPLPGDRAEVHNYSFKAASRLHVDSKGTAVRRGAPTASDGDNKSPNFSPHNPSCVSNEAAERPYLGSSDLSQHRLPSCEPRYETKQPSSEMLQESASKSRVGHNEAFSNFFPASKEDFSNEGSLNNATQATREVDVPKMRIDYNHGNGDCDYRIPAQPRKMAVAIGVGRTADPTEQGDREEQAPARRDGLSQDLARDGNTSDSRRVERGDTVHAGSKRRNPSGTDGARATINGILSFDDPGSTYDDVKRARIVGLNSATSLQSAASSAAWDVATGGQNLTRVARFSKSSTSNQASPLTENLSDEAPIKKSPNSVEYDKKLQEQLILRKQIMRRKEEQRRQEAERRRIEVEKRRENDASWTPSGAGRRKPEANKTEEMPRRSASSSLSLLPAGLAEQPFRVPTLEVSANVDYTAGTAGLIAATASTRATAFAVTGSFRDAGSGANAIRSPVAAGGTGSSGNVLLRERYRKLRLQADQGTPANKAALSTNSAPESPHRESSIRTLSDGGNSGSATALCAARVLPEPQHESSHRTLMGGGSAGNAVAPKSPHFMSNIRTASNGGNARNAAAPKSPHFLSSIRTLSDGGNAGSPAALRTPRVLPGNRRQFGADEPMSPGCESAAVGPPAAHRRREDFQPRSQLQWPQHESRHVLAVDSHSKNQSGRLLVDYGGASTGDRSADLSSHRITKVTIRNIPPSSTHLPLLLAAASFGKVLDARSDDTGVVTVEFDAVASAVRFCNTYNASVFDNAKISVEMS